jgi:hypothetical protein
MLVTGLKHREKSHYNTAYVIPARTQTDNVAANALGKRLLRQRHFGRLRWACAPKILGKSPANIPAKRRWERNHSSVTLFEMLVISEYRFNPTATGGLIV